MLQPWETMSLIKDLGSVRGRARAHLGSLKHPNRATHYPLYTSLCTGELNAILEAKMLSLQSFLRKGVSLGHVGRN